MLSCHWIKFLDFHLVWHVSLILGRRVEVTCSSRRFQLNLLSHLERSLVYIDSPRARISASTESIPFLSMVLSPACDNRSLIQRFSLSTHIRFVWRLGRNLRLFLLFAWDTLFPVIGRLPVTWHTLDIFITARIRFVNGFRKPSFISQKQAPWQRHKGKDSCAALKLALWLVRDTQPQSIICTNIEYSGLWNLSSQCRLALWPSKSRSFLLKKQ